MEIYRYLFAPVLVAVAVWSGHHQRRPIRPPQPPAVEAPGPARPTADRITPSRPGATQGVARPDRAR